MTKFYVYGVDSSKSGNRQELPNAGAIVADLENGTKLYFLDGGKGIVTVQLWPVSAILRLRVHTGHEILLEAGESEWQSL